MTLEEAIEHCNQKALGCKLGGDIKCGEDHLQLAKWLTELIDLRSEVKKLRIQLSDSNNKVESLQIKLNRYEKWSGIYL